MNITDKFQLQENEYSFPYHWVPTLNAAGEVSLIQAVDWGLEYLTYMMELARRVALASPATLLDIGCGEGRFLQMLCRHDPSWRLRYRGIDMSSRAVQLATALNESSTFSCMDVRDLKETFDGVVLIEVLEHIPDEEVGSFLAGVRSVLRPAGRLWISVPSTNVPVHAKHYRHYTRMVLKETLMAHGFSLCHVAFVSRISWKETLLRRLMLNKVFALMPSPLTAFIWRFHQRSLTIANESDGRHIIGEAILS